MNNPIFVNQQIDPDMKSRSSLFFLLSLLALILFAACNRPAAYYQNTIISSWDSASWTAFHKQAVEESLLPVRPGVPGKAPFWNAHARRFINAPSFDFPEIEYAAGYSRQYSNLERGKPLAFASLLFDRSGEHPEYLALAEELIRFAEDQFIVWERPLPREMFRTPEEPIPHNCYQTSGWFTPCALEQYGYYTPIDASAASAISAFQKAFEYTGKELYLAKAISLADNMTVAQELAGGIYPTYQRDLESWTRREDGIWQGWLNCATITSESMLKLHDLLQSMNE